MVKLSPSQLDLAVLVARLEQLRDEGFQEWLFDRVIACDLPRMRAMLEPDAVQAIENAKHTVAAPPILTRLPGSLVNAGSKEGMRITIKHYGEAQTYRLGRYDIQGDYWEVSFITEIGGSCP